MTSASTDVGAATTIRFAFETFLTRGQSTHAQTTRSQYGSYNELTAYMFSAVGSRAKFLVGAY